MIFRILRNAAIAAVPLLLVTEALSKTRFDCLGRGQNNAISVERYWGCNNTCTEFYIFNESGIRSMYVQINQQQGFTNTIIGPLQSEVLHAAQDNPAMSIECSVWD